LHVLPQRPQFCSVVVEVSQSTRTSPSHSASPAPQTAVTAPQTPLTQVATIPDGAAGQTTPQAPQLLASRPSRASQPFAAARSQFPNPGWHDDTSHAALVHVIWALEPTQALLHRPQFDSLFSAVSHPFAASPSQFPHPSSHAPMTHTPTAQRPDAWSGRQAWPQPPQCDALEEVCTHAPPHTVCPSGHGTTQLPLAHTAPTGHDTPHAPQCTTLLARSTQRRLQAVSPFGQTSVHAPEAQLSPAAHALPHAPQWDWEVSGSTQTPPHATALLGQGAQKPSLQTLPT
jgi:hypothetical protein